MVPVAALAVVADLAVLAAVVVAAPVAVVVAVIVAVRVPMSRLRRIMKKRISRSLA